MGTSLWPRTRIRPANPVNKVRTPSLALAGASPYPCAEQGTEESVAKATPSADVTGLLRAWSRGDPEAPEKLVPLIYDELRQQARRHLRRERPDHTLRPTALVHEAYLR